MRRIKPVTIPPVNDQLIPGVDSDFGAASPIMANTAKRVTCAVIA